MNAQHTPGQWIADGENVSSVFHGGRIIMRGDLADVCQNTANASLIAAAPELLAALKVAQSCLAAMPQYQDGIYDNAKNSIAAAIAKATA